MWTSSRRVLHLAGHLLTRKKLPFSKRLRRAAAGAYTRCDAGPQYGNACERDSRTYMGAGGLFRQSLRVGKSKTTAGTGRHPAEPPSGGRPDALARPFPGAQPEHYVFPHESTDWPATTANSAESCPQSRCNAGKWQGRAHVGRLRCAVASTIFGTRSFHDCPSLTLRTPP